MNSVLKIVNLKLINGIGFPYQSDVIGTTVVAVFISQYINTVVILTIANANLNNTPLGFLGVVVDNLYKDFTLRWYADVG